MNRNKNKTKTVPPSSLFITQDWEKTLALDPLYQPILIKRKHILKRLSGYQHNIDILESLIYQYLPSGCSILEVGSGDGFMVMELTAKGWQSVGLEFNPHRCRVANGAANQLGLQIRALAGDACALPFGNRTFDVVISKNFFEHVYDPGLALSEQVRILENGGLLIIMDGNLIYPKQLFDLLVMYPIRSGGQHGGIKWLLTKGRVHNNLYGSLTLGRDEDVHTPDWWRRRIDLDPNLKLIEATTVGAFYLPRLLKQLAQFIGGCVIVARKITEK